MKPLFDAGMFIVSDLLSTLIFAGLFALTGNIYLATGIGIALGVGQIVWEKLAKRPIDAMQWLSLILVVVFGGATLVTHNPLFVKVKPALIYAMVGIVMCKPGWMNRYMPAIVNDKAADIPFVFGFIWAGLMFLTGAATLVFAFRFDTKTYALFLGVFPVSSKIALFLIQYAVTRIIAVRRVKALRGDANRLEAA
jgi:intracellular septation protein A